MSLRRRGEDAPEPTEPLKAASDGMVANSAPFTSKYARPTEKNDPIADLARSLEIVADLIALHNEAEALIEAGASNEELAAKADEFARALKEIVVREPGRVLAMVISTGISGLSQASKNEKDNK